MLSKQRNRCVSSALHCWHDVVGTASAVCCGDLDLQKRKSRNDCVEIRKKIKNPLDSPQKIAIIVALDAGIAQLVEHDLAKVGVEGSNPFSRSKFCNV